MKFKDHLALYILAPLCVISLVLSFNRFMLKNDYIVHYDGTCDPSTQNCFVTCNDDACQDKTYYTKIQKRERDVYAECGQDVTDCEASNVCLATDEECSITYCSPDTVTNDETCEGVDTMTTSDTSETPVDENNTATSTNKNTP